jgi:hypothetical protein
MDRISNFMLLKEKDSDHCCSGTRDEVIKPVNVPTGTSYAMLITKS